jgi:mannose-6-phosphate isomerase-like protein (cupin superfamily)
MAEEPKGRCVLAAGEGLRIGSAESATVHARQAGSRVVVVWVRAADSPAADHEAFFAIEDLPKDELRPGTERRTLPLGAGVLMFISYLRPTTSPCHTHDHASLIYIQCGEFALQVGTESRAAVAGDGLVVQPGVPHGLRTEIAGARLIEVWYPFLLSGRNPEAAVP